jgi:hypothetical protein
MFKNNNSYKKYYLSNNRITQIGASTIIDNLNYNILVLDISNNRIGEMGAAALKYFISKT